MSDLIGTQHPARHSCGDDHLPNCYNPWTDTTACTCGAIWWRGRVGTWHSGQIRERLTITDHHGTHSRPGEVIGWDRYFLHLAECDQSESADAEPDHLCREAEAMTADEIFGGVA